MYKFVICAVFCSGTVFAVPDLVIPELEYSPEQQTVINNVDVRGAVIKSGKYKVIAAQPDGARPQSGSGYILQGKVLAVDENDNTYQVTGTDKNTLTHTISVTVSYNLLRLKDKTNVAAFNAYATAAQTKILKTGANPDSIAFNRALLIRDVSKDLAANVISQLPAEK